jgi:3-hydroxybutyryl-CoA dehydrogenase
VIRLVGVAGAGTMGSGIAQVFATSGCEVVLCDTSAAALDRARPAIEQSLAKLVEKGALTTSARDAALSRLRTSTAFDDLEPADYFVEAIAEDVIAKRALFAAADRLLRPQVILASNTSSIPIARLAAATARQDRVISLHFMNPVPLMPLVEVVRGPLTSDETVRVTLELARMLGKTAVESADRPGFIANRILMPMINEAARALAEGVGSAAAIDTVATLGFRHPMGPLALADLIGLDVCVAIMDVMATGFGDEHYKPAPLLLEKVAAGHLGRKTGRGFHDYPR